MKMFISIKNTCGGLPFAIAAILGLSAISACGRACAGSPLPMLDSVSIDGIMWKFAQKTPVGRFVTGDYYVVGNVSVVSVRPAPTDERNGSVLNVPIDPGISGFDGRVSSGRFRSSLRAVFPVAMKPGDALISSISLDTVGSIEPWLREGEGESPESPVKTVSILTCLSAPVSPDAFRPSYGDRQQKVYFADSLRRSLLPNLSKVSQMPDIKKWAWHFRRPWLDVCFFAFDAAADYQAMYGREVGRSVGMGTLMLCCDYTSAEKESLLAGMVQYGIDLWGCARAGYKGWQAHGGHGSGRKWPIIFAGLLLGDTAMASPNTTYPSLRFGEDMQTMYGPCWTGANVVYAGHQGVIDGKPAGTTPGWGPYEHKPPAQWADSNKIGEDYRRCCTSLSWIGEALAARIMKAGKRWNHDAFFDYVDRWMTENDSAAVLEIKRAKAWDYTADWARQRQCWDKFVENMWKAYRHVNDNAVLEGGAPGSSRPGLLKPRVRQGWRVFDLSGRAMIYRQSLKNGVFFIQNENHHMQSICTVK
jgi:hypothetical protein